MGAFGLTFLLVSVIILPDKSKANTDAIFKRIDSLSKEIFEMKTDLLRVEEQVMEQIEFAKASLTTTLTENIKQQLTGVIGEIVQGGSVEEMVKSRVISEVRHLKNGHHILKGRMNRVLESLGDIWEVIRTSSSKYTMFQDDRKGSEYIHGCGSIPCHQQCNKYMHCWESLKTYLVKSHPQAQPCNNPCTAECAQWSEGSCQKTWSEILKTDKTGRVLSGRKEDLQLALEQGARIKITTDTYSAETDNCQKTTTDVCCQALMHVSYAGWEKFQDRSYWWMINVCTTGNWHMVRYYVGGKYLSETRTTGAFSWFVYRNKDGSYPYPVYSTDADGSVKYGIKNELIRAIEQGQPVSVVSGRNVVFPIQNVAIMKDVSPDSKMASAEHIWSVSQRHAGNHLEFQNNAYWWFLVLTSSGSRDMSRWNLGAHTSRGHTHDTVAMDWYVDECWTMVHSTASQGSEISTLTHLKHLVEAGHSVRVKFQDTVMEADSIRISKNDISVQLISALARKNASTFEENLNWEFRVLGTTGTVRTYRPLVGSSASSGLGNTVESMAIDWFADTKTWKMLFHVTSTGSVVSGSALSVRHAVEEGADIRVGYKLPGDSGFRYSKADNVNFGPKPDLSAQLVRLLDDHVLVNNEFKLDDKPQWAFRLVNTKGYVRTTEWVVGDHVSKGKTTQQAEVKWFASS